MNDDLLLSFYKRPDHYGKIENIVPVESSNASCGDELHFYIQKNDKNVITEMKYEGAGCSVCLACAEISAEFGEKNGRLITQSELLAFIEMPEDHKRIRCATLSVINNS